MTSVFEDFRISFLNVKNLKANLTYASYLACDSDVLYLSELWCKQNEINLVKNLSTENKGKNVLFKSDMDSNYSRGRPFGGQAWILNKTLNIINHEFFNRHLSYVHLKKNGIEYMLVGVYMPFDNSKKRDDSLSSFELNLSLISTLIEKAKTLNLPIFIVGDFNADPKRTNRFDKILKEFIANLNTDSLVSNFPQSINYTFSAINNQNTINATIDHAFFIPGNNDQIVIKNCQILDDVANMSDHNAISITCKIKSLKITPEPPKILKPFKILNFNNPDIVKFYNSAIDTLLDSSNDCLPGPNNLDPQKSIDNFHIFISETVGKAESETITYQQIINNKPSISHNKTNAKKSWFSPELKNIKTQILELKKNPIFASNAIIQKEISNLKKKFRKIQRQNIYLLEQKELNKFESLARKKDKPKFWKFIKSKRKSRSNEKEVTSSPQNLFDHYSKFFFEKYTNLSKEQIEIEKEVNEMSKNYKKPEKLPFFTLDQLDMILKNLKSSNVRGHDSISYSLLKNITSIKFKLLLLDFFNQFLITGTIPSKLNYSLIKPILKDQNKSTDDKNNIRPLSISNSLAQIFERLILINSPLLNKSHKNQFGFKIITSCNHAIFTLKETIIHYTKNKSACRLASLDAEKAFDKVWRSGLFYKANNKLDPNFLVSTEKIL